MRLLLSTFAALTLFGFSNVQGEDAPRFRAEKSLEGVLISEAGQKVLFFQSRPKSLDGRFERTNYVHPLYDLSGEVLTEDFPEDHRHHRGIFWAWHQLYLGDQQLGDAWTTKDFLARVESVNVDQANPKFCLLNTKATWTTKGLPERPGEFQPVVDERGSIGMHPRTESWRLIDFEIRLRALRDGVRLGGSDDQKGYGGFSTRIKLPEGIRFRDAKGPVEPKTTAVKAGPWLDFSTEKSGLAVFDHPDNPGYPQPWILRRTRSMQNPAYPGQKPVQISQDKPLVLRYRLVVHDGSLDADALNKLYADWSTAKW